MEREKTDVFLMQQENEQIFVNERRTPLGANGSDTEKFSNAFARAPSFGTEDMLCDVAQQTPRPCCHGGAAICQVSRAAADDCIDLIILT